MRWRALALLAALSLIGVPAASAQIGVATANLYPRITLTGSLGYETSDRSSFVQEDAISPVTGQRIRRTHAAAWW